jgi:biotin carboxyl carrier protein
LTFEIEINGTSRSVTIERAGAGQFRVTIDGERRLVDAQRSGEYGVSLLVDGDSHAGATVQFAPGATPGALLAYLEGRSVAVTVNGRRTGRGAGETGGAAHGEQKIVAPMPGRVVRVLVATGDAVEARQPILVIEAMKMENELRSPKAGRIKDVDVSAGASVEAGRVLAVVE